MVNVHGENTAIIFITEAGFLISVSNQMAKCRFYISAVQKFHYLL